MRKTLFTFAVLASALTIPLTAHADAIDDFVLTGGSVDITFTLPASPPGNLFVCPPPTSGPISCQNGSQTDFTASTLVTNNGVTAMGSLDFATGRFGGGLTVGGTRFLGPQLFLPDAATPTFLIGTFNLSSFANPLTDYTLTITPETTTAPTPEPSTFALLATGALGIVSAARRRMSGRRSFN
jgi:PEP-CTERM motif